MLAKRKRKPKRHIKEDEEAGYTAKFTGTISAFGLRCILYLSSLLADVLKLMRTPIAFIITIYLIVYGISFTSQHFLLKTVCRTPMAQIFHLSSCVRAPVKLEYERLHEKYEALLQVAAPQQPLGFKMKRLEIATRDLYVMVKVSELDCKNELAPALDEYASSASAASKELIRLSSAVGAAISSILAMDEWLLRNLESIPTQPSVLESLSIVPSPANTQRRVVLAALLHIASHLSRLITMASTTMATLNRLDHQLLVIHEILSREKAEMDRKGDETFAQLWAMLAGDHVQRLMLQEHRMLLSKVAESRRQAVHDVGLIQGRLQELSSDVEEVHHRVHDAALQPVTHPLQLRLDSIRRGVEQLRERRQRLGEDMSPPGLDPQKKLERARNNPHETT